jgi:hypothetical protein
MYFTCYLGDFQSCQQLPRSEPDAAKSGKRGRDPIRLHAARAQPRSQNQN